MWIESEPAGVNTAVVQASMRVFVAAVWAAVPSMEPLLNLSATTKISIIYNIIDEERYIWGSIYSDFLQNLEIRAPNIPNNGDVSLRSFIGRFCCFVKKNTRY